ncbi:hypothetical protein SAMN05444354_105126 [Stigmatella aurantiaca]|uniref:Uncharacterized protein n=1 Tax=Stigmatella aurantiaca TaxID=41 RepID=A0A1H7P191_STIAU|nr:hypothetical protein [Stigmatella aurantiaca]SEL29015.1 hypothetical protein SAMN05444354_105126 [Stigmatella aurantiaca]
MAHSQKRIGGPGVRTCLERGTVIGNLDCDDASVNKNASNGAITLFGTGKPATGVAAVVLGATRNWSADPALYRSGFRPRRRPTMMPHVSARSPAASSWGTRRRWSKG